MVNLTRIYTRTGDAGETRLANNETVPKTDLRLEAYGTVDEANAALGVVLALPGLADDLAGVLRTLQNDLFDVGADLATPLDADSALRATDAMVARLEAWCDKYNADLVPLRSFVLPGGTPAAAGLGVARTVVRRAERAAWLAAEQVPLNPVAIRYLNRASDLLFILGRYANAGCPEVLWVPGGPADEG